MLSKGGWAAAGSCRGSPLGFSSGLLEFITSWLNASRTALTPQLLLGLRRLMLNQNEDCCVPPCPSPTRNRQSPMPASLPSGCFFPFSIYHLYSLFSLRHLHGCLQQSTGRQSYLGAQPIPLCLLRHLGCSSLSAGCHSSSAAKRLMEGSVLCWPLLGGRIIQVGGVTEAVFPLLGLFVVFARLFVCVCVCVPWICGFCILVIRTVVLCGVCGKGPCMGFKKWGFKPAREERLRTFTAHAFKHISLITNAPETIKIQIQIAPELIKET